MGTHVRFGSFELNEDRAELRCNGALVKLPPQPFKALLLMASRPGCLVSRDELRQALWGEGRFVDFDAGLNFCIRQLRAALDDPAARSAIIAAVPRRGYKFVAPIVAGSPDRGIAGSQDRGIARPGHPAIRRSAPWLIAALSSLVAAGVIVVGKTGGSHDPADGDRRRLIAAEKEAQGALALADAGPAELVARIQFFQDALAADPRFAPAYASLAEAHLIAGAYRVDEPQTAYARARTAAARALELQPDLADAHAMFGAAALYLDWDWARAERHLRRALELNAESARAHQYYSRLLSARGVSGDAIGHARRAVELSPGSASARTDLGLALFHGGRLREAVAACDEAAGMLPAFLPALRCAADAAAEDGAQALAARYVAMALATSGDAVPAGLGREDFWIGRARRLQAGMSDDDCCDRNVALAVALAHLGDADRALRLLARAADRHNDAMLFANVHPAFRPLRGDVRFARVVTRIGLPRS